MLRWLRTQVENIATNIIGAILFAGGVGTGLLIWGAVESVPAPVLVASVIASVGGALGMAAFVSRHVGPRAIIVEARGLKWRQLPDGDRMRIVPLCPDHEVEVFDDSGDGYLRSLSYSSVIQAIHCAAEGGHSVNVPLDTVKGGFTAAAALIDHARMRR